MNDLEQEMQERREAEDRVIAGVNADIDAGKVAENDALDEIDRRLIAAGLKKKSDPPYGTIIMYGEVGS
jgi:hypothetical protein